MDVTTYPCTKSNYFGERPPRYIDHICPIYSGVPGPPSMPDITEITGDSCKLSWQPPQNDGGAPIIAYVIERKSGSSATWLPMKKKATMTEFVATDLSEGSAYEFRIVAENKMGLGKPGPQCAPVMIKNPYSKHNALPVILWTFSHKYSHRYLISCKSDPSFLCCLFPC